MFSQSTLDNMNQTKKSIEQRSVNLLKNIVYYINIIVIAISDKLRKALDKLIQFSPNIHQNEIIIFDLETTGLNPYHDKIIDYAFQNFKDDNDYIESLVNPRVKFEKKITDITGIQPDELENIAGIECHTPKIYNYINHNSKKVAHKVIPTRYLVAHNCHGFDKIFLMKEFQKSSVLYPHSKNWQFIDTLLMAKKLLPKLKSHSLKALAEHYDIKPGTHRALSDTKTLSHVFKAMLEDFCKTEGHVLDSVIENPQIIADYYSF